MFDQKALSQDEIMQIFDNVAKDEAIQIQFYKVL